MNTYIVSLTRIVAYGAVLEILAHSAEHAKNITERLHMEGKLGDMIHSTHEKTYPTSEGYGWKLEGDALLFQHITDMKEFES